MGSWVYLMIYSASSLQVEHCLGWRLRRWTSNWIMYVTCMYVWRTTETRLLGWPIYAHAFAKASGSDHKKNRAKEGGWGGSRSFCYVTFFGSPCVHVFFFFYHFFSFLSLLFFCFSGCFLLFHALLFLFVCLFLYGFILFRSGAHNPERLTSILRLCNGVFTSRSIFR